MNFRKLLITRCQLEFEKNSIDENARNLKLKEIDECTDPVSDFSSSNFAALWSWYFFNNWFILQEKKKELQFVLEEDDRRLRIKSVGNIRFIGRIELFLQFYNNAYNILCFRRII